MPAGRTNLYERYELGEVLGRGGMGVVYRAVDRLMQREVALKTLLDIDNPPTLDLFYKECGILAAMVHPNIIDVYDVGEFDDNGVKKAFFVMPLLPGATLDRILRKPGFRITVESLIAIVTQACRGLEAAHQAGLVHRDVKPSNIFVMEDESVKMIDFKIARTASLGSMTGMKGTVSYMAPEQLQYLPPTPLSDQYSLAVVCYEALAGRRPFQGAAEPELAEAILHQEPPPVSDLNSGVRPAVSQVIRKAMAKQPAQRFPNMREFSDTLNRALRGEALEPMDADKIKPRLERATAAFEQGDFEFASELLSELESEGYLDENIGLLRGRLQQSISRTRVRQLLESANRCLRAQEYPLALRKIQEALDLDPELPDALLLRSRVQQEQCDKKVAEWLQLARVQADNQSFPVARESLSAALKLKPNETEALRLMAEISRREQELGKTREHKAVLYESAVQAWERGEVNAALGRLEELLAMERESPDSGAGRGAKYHSFYQQVRSEHDALAKSYQEARERLAAKDFEPALALCARSLARYPNHALFQALQADATALARPQSSARMLAEKRDLVASVAGKAQFYEQRELFAEALDQWEMVKEIEPGYPGLDAQIGRLAALRDGRTRQAAKQRSLESIARAIRTGDYDRALRTVQEARREFPDDPEFSACEREVSERSERTAQAFAMIDRARQHADAKRPQDSLAQLRQAVALDGVNPVVRTVVLHMMIDHARLLIQQNPDDAELALRDVLLIEPGHAEAQSLCSQIDTGKRLEFVNMCVDQARRMEQQGNVPGALVLVRRGLGAYPDDPTLLQLQAALSGTPAAPIAPPAQPLPDATGALLTWPVSSSTPGPSPSAAPPPPPPRTAPAPVLEPKPPLSPPPPIPPVPPRPKPHWMPAALGVGVLLLLVLGFAFMRFRKPVQKSPATVLSKVTLQASPAHASILVDGRACGAGNCTLDLPAGQHRAEATLDGYSPASAAFEIRAGAPNSPLPVHLTLIPRLPMLVVLTNLNQATVSLDQGAQQPVQNGEIQLQELAAGQRTIRFVGEGAQGVLSVTVAPAAAPRVDLPVQQQNLGTTIVSSLGGTAKIFTTLQKAEALLDGKPAGKIEPTGVDLTNLAPGAHELVVTAQGISHRLSFNAGAAPAMAVFFGSERNQGVLRITTGESDVTVYVNGVKTRRATQNGRLILYLEPKTYKIRVEKAGFQPVAEQSIEIKKGVEARADFTMAREPEAGSVLVARAPAGAEVELDGAPVGTVQADGMFPLHDLKPGNHTLAIKKDSFKAVTRQISVVAGQQLEVDGTLQPLAGTVKITVAPPDVPATLSWKREGEENTQTFTDNPLTLPEGSYTITGHAPGYEEARTTAKITPGHATAAVLVFRKIAVTKVEPAKQLPGLADVEKTGGWTRENGVLTRTGGNNILLPIAPAPGTYSFQAMMPKGKRLVWLVNYVDAKNYVVYELNEDRLERAEYIDGKKVSTSKPRLRVKLGQWIQVTVEVTETEIVTSVQQDANRYQAIDRFAREGASPAPNQSFLRGRFGFRVPGKDRLVVASFTFTPK